MLFLEVGHLLEDAPADREGGGVGMELVVHEGTGVGHEPAEDIHGGRGHGFGSDHLHLADGRDGGGLLEAELPVLAGAITDLAEHAAILEEGAPEVVDRHEAAEVAARHATEVGDVDRAVGRRLEADHGPRDDPADPEVRGATEQVEQTTVDRGGVVLQHEPVGDAVAVGGLGVGEADLDTHAAGGHGPDVDPDDAHAGNRVDDPQDVVVDHPEQVAGAAGQGGDVDGIDDDHGVELLDQAEHELGVEDVDVVADHVLDTGDALWRLAAIEGEGDQGKGAGQQAPHDGGSHEAGTSEDEDTAFHDDLSVDWGAAVTPHLSKCSSTGIFILNLNFVNKKTKTTHFTG